MRKTLVSKITVYDGGDPVVIKTYRKDSGAPFEIRIDGAFWSTCENYAEVDEEINCIINLYGYKFFPNI